MPSWTKEQQQAIIQEGSNILVSAGAGSGKTAVLSERALRGIKSKMKVSGQFQNVTNAEYYAAIRSYIETCYRNGINGHEALIRLMNDNPYTLEEIIEIGKQNVEKSK